MRYLLVDGHSVIFSWPELRALHQRKPAQAREELIRDLQPLHDSGEWAVTLVFDGKVGITPARRAEDMVIAYASADETADSVIERLVAFHQPRVKEEIFVVTADGAESLTVESLGGVTMSPERLREELEGATARMQSSLRNAHQRAKW
jgi:predicted RNA-binding protein with PIN domain